MRSLLLALMILCGFAYSVEVPDSLLTESQKAYVNQKSTQENVKGWIGIGAEVGKAVDASMQAITARTNEFANTPMGKLTVVLVVWKVMSGTFVALFAIVLFTLIFIAWGLYIAYMYRNPKLDAHDRDVWKDAAMFSFCMYIVFIVVSLLNI